MQSTPLDLGRVEDSVAEAAQCTTVTVETKAEGDAEH